MRLTRIYRHINRFRKPLAIRVVANAFCTTVQQNTLVSGFSALLCSKQNVARAISASSSCHTDMSVVEVDLFDVAIADIEAIIGEDVGKRGIAAITLPHQLSAAASAFLDAKAVVILTGFPCRMSDTPPTETDGPPGAVALAMTSLKLGKPTAIATDTSSASVLMRCCMAAGLPSMGDFALYSFPPTSEWSVDDTERLHKVIAEYDHAVAIERAGRAVDGSYYTMRAYKMDHLVAPIDELITEDCASGLDEHAFNPVTSVVASPATDDNSVFPSGTAGRSTACQTDPLPYMPQLVFTARGAEIAGDMPTSPMDSRQDRSRTASIVPFRGDLWSRTTSFASIPAFSRTSTGIGDGGNECGMGKALEAVRAHIPRGATIACVVPADNLITAGVSNWGGWGLCAAVEALLRHKVSDKTANIAPEASSPGSPMRTRRRPSDGCIDFAVQYLVQGQPPGFLLPSEEFERSVAQAMVAAGARDGITGALDGSVDGMPLETHLGVLTRIRAVLTKHF
jgi:hypothetical protein